MKKLIFTLIFFAFLATGTVFADHPNGVGVGIFYGTGTSWGDDYWYNHLPNDYWPGYYGLSLKIPGIPIFWGINMRFNAHFFSLGLIGDKYFIDSVLVKDIGLHWFLGLGLYVNMAFFKENAAFAFGARLPVGLSWQPVKPLEIFLNLAPSLGLNINPLSFPVGGLGAEFGIRLWF